jgi:hypothetical protein
MNNKSIVHLPLLLVPLLFLAGIIFVHESSLYETQHYKLQEQFCSTYELLAGYSKKVQIKCFSAQKKLITVKYTPCNVQETLPHIKVTLNKIGSGCTHDTEYVVSRTHTTRVSAATET